MTVVAVLIGVMGGNLTSESENTEQNGTESEAFQPLILRLAWALLDEPAALGRVLLTRPHTGTERRAGPLFKKASCEVRSGLARDTRGGTVFRGANTAVKKLTRG